MESKDMTVTDKNDVALMKLEDIRRWISLHQRALQDENLSESHEDIQKDLEVLIAEYELRNPLLPVLREIKEVLEGINQSLKKETSTYGTTKN